jgi:hypothetical protein
MALLLTLFALLLISAIGLFLVLSSDTETRIDANYGSSLRAYYAARSGLEEVRDRIKRPSSAGGLADLLPQDIAGNTGGVLYIVNLVNGEMVDPTDVTSPYFDDDLCHSYNSGVPRGTKCTAAPTMGQVLPRQFSLPPDSGPLGYAWVRVNMKTNRIAAPYFVDQTGISAPLDARVCWDGQAEQLSPSTVNPSCDANGMQSVYMVTALALTSRGKGPGGARKLVQSEVVAPSIRPAGALTATSMNLTTSGTAGVPPVAIDGRVHRLDGTLSTGSGCSSISSLATNSGSTQMEQALDQIRKSIVDTANMSCNADGSDMGSNTCTPGLWWVRGTDAGTRYVTSTTASSTSGSSGGSGHDSHGGGDYNSYPTGVSSAACDPSISSCYTNLDLAAPQLFAIAATPASHIPDVTLPANATAPFVGGSGNQTDATIYQPAGTQTLANQIATVNNLVAGSQTSANYFTPSSSTLSSSYGSSTAPAVVVFTDQTLSLQSGASLSGFGLLVIPSALEISNANLSWNGIVLINSGTGHVTVGSGATGFINGALLLAPGAVFNFPSSASANPAFRISYSCEAIDLSFSALPFKIVSTAETSF